jgi:DNA-binding response OmpR family regulator
MPDGDGLSLLAEAKRTLQNPPPFIFVSAHPGITEEHVKELGAIGLVRKPFVIDEILERIKTALSRG